MPPPLVSVVVVNYRTEATLPQCLASVRRQTYPRVELVLVNNGSPDFYPLWVEEFAPDRLINLDQNLGFARGNNLGIEASRGNYILTLNADAYLEPDWIERAVELMEEDPNLGWLGGKILYAGNPSYFDSAGHLLFRERVARGRGHNEEDRGQFNTPARVFGHSACCCLYRKSALESVAYPGREGTPCYFAEELVSYFEDVDLDWRLNRAGWHSLYHPDLVCYHWGGQSGLRTAFPVRLRGELNLQAVIWRNLTLGELFRDLPWIAGYHTLHYLTHLNDRLIWAALERLPRELIRALRFRLLLDPVGRKRPARPPDPSLIATRGKQVAFRAPPPPPRQPAPSLSRLDYPLPPVGKEFSPFLEWRHSKPAADQPAVSLIVLNLNGLALTARCLESLARQTYSNFEVVMVDNGSRRNEAALLRERFPRLRTIRLPENRGFTGGVNEALKVCAGQLIALLNNDAEAHPRWLAELVATWRRTGAPAVSSVIVNRGESLAEAQLSGTIGIFGQTIPRVLGRAEWVYYPSGGACLLDLDWLIRHRVPYDPERRLLFPPHYFAYYEDVWLGIRIQRAGGRIARALNAVVEHAYSETALRELGPLRLRMLRAINRLRIIGEIWRFWWQLGSFPAAPSPPPALGPQAQVEE